MPAIRQKSEIINNTIAITVIEGYVGKCLFGMVVCWVLHGSARVQH